MSTGNLSGMEAMGLKIHDKIFESRILLGAIVLIIVTGISITFNTFTGHWMATDEASRKLLPISYAAIAFSGVVITAIVFFGKANIFLKMIGVVTLLLIFALDIFASLTFQIATDARNESTGDSRKYQELQKNIETSNQSVEIWTEKLALTKKYHVPWNEKLKEAKAERDRYQRELEALDEAYTPPILMVFQKLYDLVPLTIDGDKKLTLDQFKTLIRSAWSFMLASLPYVLTLIIFGEIRGMMKSGQITEKKCNAGQGSAADRTSQAEMGHGPATEENVVWSELEKQLLNDLETTMMFGPTESQQSDQVWSKAENPVEFGPIERGPKSNVVLFEERRPDQTKTTGPNEQTKPHQTGPKQTTKRSRRTGLDRDIAAKIEEYLINGKGPIATGQVAKRFGVGKSLLSLVYESVKKDGHIDQPNGPGTKWIRTNPLSQTG